MAPRQWKRAPNGRRYLAGPPRLPGSDLGPPPTPDDPFALLPLSERQYEERELPGGFTVLTYTDGPADDCQASEDAPTPALPLVWPSPPALTRATDEGWQALMDWEARP